MWWKLLLQLGKDFALNVLQGVLNQNIVLQGLKWAGVGFSNGGFGGVLKNVGKSLTSHTASALIPSGIQNTAHNVYSIRRLGVWAKNIKEWKEGTGENPYLNISFNFKGSKSGGFPKIGIRMNVIKNLQESGWKRNKMGRFKYQHILVNDEIEDRNERIKEEERIQKELERKISREAVRKQKESEKLSRYTSFYQYKQNRKALNKFMGLYADYLYGEIPDTDYFEMLYLWQANNMPTTLKNETLDEREFRSLNAATLDQIVNSHVLNEDLWAQLEAIKRAGKIIKKRDYDKARRVEQAAQRKMIREKEKNEKAQACLDNITLQTLESHSFNYDTRLDNAQKAFMREKDNSFREMLELENMAKNTTNDAQIIRTIEPLVRIAQKVKSGTPINSTETNLLETSLKQLTPESFQRFVLAMDVNNAMSAPRWKTKMDLFLDPSLIQGKPSGSKTLKSSWLLWGMWIPVYPKQKMSDYNKNDDGFLIVKINPKFKSRKNPSLTYCFGQPWGTKYVKYGLWFEMKSKVHAGTKFWNLEPWFYLRNRR